MGYDTKFKGVLKFTSEVTVPQIRAMQAMFGENPDDHPDWLEGTGLDRWDVGYIDLRLTKEMDGLQWEYETEKTRGLENGVNIVIREMRKQWPDFGLSGELLAQGEDITDRWILRIGADGWATKIENPPKGRTIECPNCREDFFLEEVEG